MMMKSENSNQLYRTSDLALCGALVCVGFVIEKVERVSQSRAVFLFQSTEKLQETVNKFWRNELLVDPLRYFGEIKLLKARIFEH